MKFFMTKVQFYDKYKVDKDFTDGITRIQVYDKATGEMVYSTASNRPYTKVLTDMYFELNVVNYVDANK